jgi:4-hydroxy-tetrahydrodipicolinate synthase
MGKCSAEVRLPLCEMGEGNKAKLAGIMKEYSLI